MKLLLLGFLHTANSGFADIYISRTQWRANDLHCPVVGYQLVTKRDTITNTGYILANRPIQTGGPTEFKHHIRRASKQYGVDAALIEAVIQVESGFDPNAVSKKVVQRV